MVHGGVLLVGESPLDQLVPAETVSQDPPGQLVRLPKISSQQRSLEVALFHSIGQQKVLE